MTPEEIRYRAAMTYARLQRDGSKPLMCHPPAKVVQKRKADGVPRLKPKLIFDTPELANLFMWACESTGPGPIRSYPCPFSKTGHVHVTSKPERNGHR